MATRKFWRGLKIGKVIGPRIAMTMTMTGKIDRRWRQRALGMDSLWVGMPGPPVLSIPAHPISHPAPPKHTRANIHFSPSACHNPLHPYPAPYRSTVQCTYNNKNWFLSIVNSYECMACVSAHFDIVSHLRKQIYFAGSLNKCKSFIYSTAVLQVKSVHVCLILSIVQFRHFSAATICLDFLRSHTSIHRLTLQPSMNIGIPSDFLNFNCQCEIP